MARPDSEDRRIEELLPWHVNGTLTEDEDAEVSRYVEEHPESAREVEILRHVYDVVCSEEYGSPGEFGRRRLWASIRKDERPDSSRETIPRWLRPALAAAVLLIVVQGGLLVQSWRVDNYEPAGVSSEGPTLQLRFSRGATEQQIRDLLNEFELEIVSGPGSVGVYRVVPMRRGTNPQQIADGLRDAGQIVIFVEVE